MLSVFRNSLSRMAVRVALGLFLPGTRAGTIRTFSNLTYGVLRRTVFSENFLHNRIFRHIVHSATDILSLSTFWFVASYKKLRIDPPSTTTMKPTTTTTTTTTTEDTTTVEAEAITTASLKQFIRDYSNAPNRH